MPDWTYHPLRSTAARVLGRRRAERAALHLLATLTSRPAGARAVSAVFAHRVAPPGLAHRLGATVPVRHARDAVRALPVQGAGVIEIGPVTQNDVPAVRAAVAGRTCTVFARTADPAVAAALEPYVDRVIVDAEPARSGSADGIVRLTDPAIGAAQRALADRSAVVLATTGVLVAAGPGWFQRVIEVQTPSRPAPGLRDAGRDPRRWPAWLWGLLVGAGMIGAGIGAAMITLGPVLLWYDNDYLGMRREQLTALNERLVPFLQHDRVTMAGTMIAIGVLYAGLAWGGIRQGWPWARTSYLLSGAVGFPSVLYFLGSGFVEPLHTAVTVVLFPMFVLTVVRRPDAPRWTLLPDGPEPQRRRALIGQLLMIVTGLGLLTGGLVVSVVGLTDVFVATDLGFLGTHAAPLLEGNPRLLPYIAHDRAGFGGALIAAALAIMTLSAWGWRRGSGWVWWTLAGAAVAGFLPAVAVHMVIGYTSVEHLAPVYLGIAFTGVALALSRPYLCVRTVPAGSR
ncbi:hypothetical protein QLQ12_00155 [Actinoplanes sp. NEAU-A12]|uniref:Uncharacterized protein n=1 Tax=Actinoplanes sandaracinus TaxID=3045177 RepID=A0ABT6WBB4_9ACTN|nr:hypothetical protein [Actinoplanes sandaracinus]MDI6097018.1 hypothetical protein [Actinoplanes sandaracinus]